MKKLLILSACTIAVAYAVPPASTTCSNEYAVVHCTPHGDFSYLEFFGQAAEDYQPETGQHLVKATNCDAADKAIGTVTLIRTGSNVMHQNEKTGKYFVPQVGDTVKVHQKSVIADEPIARGSVCAHADDVKEAHLPIESR